MEATIHLAEKRGCTQNNKYRSFHTFNYDDHQKDIREPVYSLKGLNDDTIQASTTKNFLIEEDTIIFILPVIGGIEYQINNSEKVFMDVGECRVFYLPESSEYNITNPYQSNLVNYIHLWFSVNAFVHDIKFRSIFDLDQDFNALMQIFSFNQIHGYLGKFSGRKKSTFQSYTTANGVYAFVIDGAFEFQDRLLQPRDGLFLKSTELVEFEALSDQAVILILEI